MSPASAPASGSLRQAYLVVFVGISGALHVWKLPPALPMLTDEFGLTLVESGFLLSLVQLGGLALGLVMGLLAGKIGLRRSVLIGLFLLGAASAAGALPHDKNLLMALRGVEGCGFLMVVMPCPALIRRLVAPAQLSRVLGMWGTYMPLGTVIILLGGSWMLAAYNWRTLWLLLAAVSLLMLGLIWRILPADPPPNADGQPVSSVWQIVRATLTSQKIGLIAVAFGVYTGQWNAVIGFLPTIYILGDISGPTAGVLTAIVAGSNAIGCIGAGRLLHRGLRARTLLISGYATMAVTSFVAFGTGAPVPVQFLAVLLFSTMGGLVPATLFWLVMELAPSPNATAASIGWAQQVSSGGQFVGPPLVAWVATLVGGWQGTWLVTGLGCAAGVAIALRLSLLSRHPKI